jgi:hypothetical protein
VGRLAAVAALLVVASALVVASVAFAAKGDPKKHHTRADMSRARSVVLRAADLPVGWKSAPSSSRGGGNLHCKGFEPDESDLTETGNVDSPDFSKSLAYISSSASVYLTAAQAQASWNRVVKPGLLTCLKSLFEQGASSGGTTTRVLGEGQLAFPKLAPRTAAFRISFLTKSTSLSLKGDVDVVLLGRGRIDVVMLFVAFGAPDTTLEHRLAGVVAKRMT